MKIAEQLQRYLYSRGVRNIFGIVGREASAISFEEYCDINFVLTRHEMSAGTMAIAVSRFTRSPQVCFATIGPGITNLVTPIATAALDRYPLIVLGAQLETDEIDFNNAHQCVDNISVVKPLTKFAYEVRDPNETISTLEKAICASMTQPFGPSFVSLPVNILTSEAKNLTNKVTPPSAVESFYDMRCSDYEEKLRDIVKMIESSRNPLIVVGDAALRVGEWNRIKHIAEGLNVPVVSSYSAKGVLPPEHPLYYGAITPYMDSVLGFPAIKSIFDEPDMLLLVGYDLVEHLYPKLWTTGNPKKIARLCAFTNNTPREVKPDIDAVGPLREGLQYLEDHISEISGKEPYGIAKLKSKFKELASDRKEHAAGILPHQIFSVLNEHFSDYILANDVGLHRHTSALFYRANNPLDFVTSAGLSSFGTGIPLGIGSKIANPSREVVVICGDGGLLSNIGELETAARIGLKLTVVLFSNKSSGLIERYQMMGHNKINPSTVRMHPVNFAKIAEGCGCLGIKINSLDEFEPALERADGHGGVTLIEAPIHYPNLYINEFTKNYHLDHTS
ncbi:3D-(3,5/4)-trihydroxycyclohexane-1,2-dione hydrolase [Candidatus Norongarragalina meridionalis]|nr:3D-(3,5/4)-trihydroxycyclohexane-1,2-dione hydrolase [Candidatus Norongarragalina meridionalis]